MRDPLRVLLGALSAALPIFLIPALLTGCRLRIETGAVAAPTTAALETIPTASCTVHELNLVSHTDDDLLFMNPDIDEAIDHGHCMRSVYLTAGDAGREESYVVEREAGVRAAYAVMAGVPDQWAHSDLTIDGFTIRSFTLEQAPRVSLSFLGVPDGIEGAGSDRYGHASLSRLWDGELSHANTVDGLNRFSKQALIDVLTGILHHDHAALVRTLERTGAYGRDHNDHRNSARFAIAAYEHSDKSATHLSYRGYNISDLPANLDEAAVHAKWEAFWAYVQHDPALANGRDPIVTTLYAGWAARQYPTSGTEPDTL